MKPGLPAGVRGGRRDHLRGRTARRADRDRPAYLRTRPRVRPVKQSPAGRRGRGMREGSRKGTTFSHGAGGAGASAPGCTFRPIEYIETEPPRFGTTSATRQPPLETDNRRCTHPFVTISVLVQYLPGGSTRFRGGGCSPGLLRSLSSSLLHKGQRPSLSRVRYGQYPRY